MQPQNTHESDEGSKRRRKVQQGNLLLVGGEEGFKDITHRLFFGRRLRISGRSTTLLEGLFCLEFEAIDVVLLSREFREEEASLFAFDAQRLGFTGLILHVAFLPSDRALSHRGVTSGGKLMLERSRLVIPTNGIRPIGNL